MALTLIKGGKKDRVPKGPGKGHKRDPRQRYPASPGRRQRFYMTTRVPEHGFALGIRRAVMKAIQKGYKVKMSSIADNWMNFIPYNSEVYWSLKANWKVRER